MINLPSWLAALGGGLLTALVAFALHTLDVDGIRATQTAALAAQEQSLTKQCDDAQQITKRIAHDYETQLTDANARINKLRSTSICVPVPSPARGHNGATASSGSVGQNGITAQALYDYAGDYKRERLKEIALQEYANSVIEFMKRGAR